MIAGNRYVDLRAIRYAEYKPEGETGMNPGRPAVHFIQEIGDTGRPGQVFGEDATTIWEGLVALSREEP